MYLFCGRIIAGLILAASAFAAETPAAVKDAISKLEQRAATAPAAAAVEFRVKAAQALQGSWPELAADLASRSIAQLRSGSNWRLTPDIMRTLTILAPSGAVSVLPRMAPNYGEYVINGLAEIHQVEAARSVYRNLLTRGGRVTAASGLLFQLANEKSTDVGNVYRDILSGFSFDTLEPQDALWILSETKLVQDIAPAAAVEGIVRILDAASNPGYGENATSSLRGEFEIGSKPVTTANSRDALLLLAGARLFALAPGEFEKRKDVFSPWGIAGPLVVKSVSGNRGVPGKVKTLFTSGRMPPQIGVVSRHMAALEGQANADPDSLIIQLAGEVRRLPPGWGKLDRARGLCESATKGEHTTAALTAAASALAHAIRDSHPTLDPGRQATSFGEDYLRLAELIRYEHVRLAFTDPAINLADALLALRERILEHTGFAVASMDGKPHTLSAAPGKAALISFVTTVCPRYLDFCERQLPALEGFYQEFGKKGVAVFAITSEDQRLLTESLQGETYTVPLFLDPRDKVAGVFGVPSRHESFLFDREGKLVARAIGIRTEDQLREMAKKAGVE